MSGSLLHVVAVCANRIGTVLPTTDTYLLFPYEIVEGKGQLISGAEMQSRFPLAWRYLKKYERTLRGREDGKMDIDSRWWGYVYPKNLEKHTSAKLVVPRLVRNVSCSVDTGLRLHLDNVDVGGVLPANDISLYFLAAVINSRTSSFVFRRISRHFRGNFRSANRQYVAPLPIPNASARIQEALAADARRLQTLCTERRDKLCYISRRLIVLTVRRQPDNWLFPDLPSVETLTEEAPNRLFGVDRVNWARAKLNRELKLRHDSLDEQLAPGVSLSAELSEGELRLLVDGIPVLRGIFPAPSVAQFVLAQWRVLTNRLEGMRKLTGKKMAAELRTVSISADTHIRKDIVEHQLAIARIEEEVWKLEDRINRRIYRLHDLSQNDIKMVEGDSW